MDTRAIIFNPSFGRKETNQALDEEAPAHERQYYRYSRPDVMKPDDDGCQWQIQKPVHECADFPLGSQEDEELGPDPGLEEVREAKHSEQNDGKDFN